MKRFLSLLTVFLVASATPVFAAPVALQNSAQKEAKKEYINVNNFTADEIVPISVNRAEAGRFSSLAFYKRGFNWGVVDKDTGSIVIDDKINVRWCPMCGIASYDEHDVYSAKGELVAKANGHGGIYNTLYYETRQAYFGDYTNSTLNIFQNAYGGIGNVVTSEIEYEMSSEMDKNVPNADKKFWDSLDYTDIYALSDKYGNLKGRFFDDVAVVPRLMHVSAIKPNEQYYQPEFTGIGFESEFDIFAGKRNGKWKFYEANGRELALGVYDNAQGFSNAFAAVCLNGKWAYIAENSGIAVTPFLYDAATPLYDDGTAWVKVGKIWRVEKIIDSGHAIPTAWPKTPKSFLK